MGGEIAIGVPWTAMTAGVDDGAPDVAKAGIYLFEFHGGDAYRAAIKTRMRVNQDENAAGGLMAGFAPSGVTIGGTTP